MSTRAVYTFKDKIDLIHVYKHHDGDPKGASRWLLACLTWEAPRYEASDFAAAFVQANRIGEGSVRLIGLYPEGDAKSPGDAAGDTEFLYEITGPDTVTAWNTCGNGERYMQIYSGTFKGLALVKIGG